jgi:hypothetical protein
MTTKKEYGGYKKAYKCGKCQKIRYRLNSGICPKCGNENYRKVVARIVYEYPQPRLRWYDILTLGLLWTNRYFGSGRSYWEEKK